MTPSSSRKTAQTSSGQSPRKQRKKPFLRFQKTQWQRISEDGSQIPEMRRCKYDWCFLQLSKHKAVYGQDGLSERARSAERGEIAEVNQHVDRVGMGRAIS